MIFSFDPMRVRGDALSREERDDLAALLRIYAAHRDKNGEKERYYEGRISLRSVNLGIALPEGMAGLEIGCAWGAKTVDVLAARSIFDGYVAENGGELPQLDRIVRGNRLIAEYFKASRDELKFGTTFATLSSDPEIGCKIRWHSPMTAAARWSGEKGRIASGFAIIDTVPDETEESFWTPTVINYYTDEAIIVLKKQGADWAAERHPHRMGRPLMEPMIWNATSNKPFGRSRIKEPIRRLIDGYVRTLANASIGLEFATSPQKYLLGITDQQYDAVTSQKFRQYVGSIIAGTTNPETGEKPSFGQLSQGSISPHVEMLRILATQFSAATGLTVTDTGVVSEANPTSSDAILAQSQTLVRLAEELNTGNGESLRSIALMAMAVAKECTVEELSEEEKAVVAHFRNPAMPSVAVTADAAIKIASAREGFGSTDTFLEMIGFSQADIRRIKAQESRTRGLSLLNTLEEENGEVTETGETA